MKRKRDESDDPRDKITSIQAPTSLGQYAVFINNTDEHGRVSCANISQPPNAQLNFDPVRVLNAPSADPVKITIQNDAVPTSDEAPFAVSTVYQGCDVDRLFKYSN
jgi:hypothetical protein